MHARAAVSSRKRVSVIRLERVSRKVLLVWREKVVSQFEFCRLYVQGRALVPLVKTRDFGMTPLGNLEKGLTSFRLGCI